MVLPGAPAALEQWLDHATARNLPCVAVRFEPDQHPGALTLQKNIRFPEPSALELRIEAFNAFNHAQFYGPASVNGQVEDPNFGQIVSAATPRLVQLVAKVYF